MQLWPTTVPEEQTKLSYLFIACITTCTFGFLWWKPLGFIVACLWALLTLWNLVLGPMVIENWDEDEVEIPEDFAADAAFQRFVNGDTDQLRNELATVKKELEDIKRARGGFTINDSSGASPEEE